MWYILNLNLHRAVCQLYLYKTGKKMSFIRAEIFPFFFTAISLTGSSWHNEKVCVNKPLTTKSRYGMVILHPNNII